jgi:DNA-binding NarL/FixJ family response regulator
MLEDHGFSVDAIGDDTNLVSLADSVDVVVVDIGMPGSIGMTALEELHAAQVHTPVVAFSTTSQPYLRLAAEMLGVSAFVPTIGDPFQLRCAVQSAASQRRPRLPF